MDQSLSRIAEVKTLVALPAVAGKVRMSVRRNSDRDACAILTLVMGPGGYEFGHYARLGAPLSLLVLVLGVPLIMITWPLTR